MKDIRGLTCLKGAIVAEGLGLRWTRDKHYLGANNGEGGTLWHEQSTLHQCDNLMKGGVLCNGHPMTQEFFLAKVHKESTT